MNNNTNNELNKIVCLLQKNKVYEIDSEELYELFMDYDQIKKHVKNKTTKRYFPSVIKRFCKMNNYKFEIINKHPVVSRFYFYTN